MDMDVRIVVVDDDRANVLLMRRMLERAGYVNVAGTSDPGEAVELCMQEPTELLLVDLHMPGRNGYDVMAELRGRDRAPEIIVLTGDASDAVADRARGAGAGGVLVKPYSYEELLAEVSARLRGQVAG